MFKLLSILAFPSKAEDLNLILNWKYIDIKKIINERVEEFFNIYEMNSLIEQTYYSQKTLNFIFKKILLENNRMNDIKINKNTSILSNLINESCKTRILLISEFSDADNIKFDQKLLFLMKRQNIVLDCVSIGSIELNVIIYYISFWIHKIFKCKYIFSCFIKFFS
jgi:hypothetical protein